MTLREAATRLGIQKHSLKLALKRLGIRPPRVPNRGTAPRYEISGALLAEIARRRRLEQHHNADAAAERCRSGKIWLCRDPETLAASCRRIQPLGQRAASRRRALRAALR